MQQIKLGKLKDHSVYFLCKPKLSFLIFRTHREEITRLLHNSLSGIKKFIQVYLNQHEETLYLNSKGTTAQEGKLNLFKKQQYFNSIDLYDNYTPFMDFL